VVQRRGPRSHHCRPRAMAAAERIDYVRGAAAVAGQPVQNYPIILPVWHPLCVCLRGRLGGLTPESGEEKQRKNPVRGME